MPPNMIFSQCDIIHDRSWAGDLFIGADALMSALKQIHVEADPALRFLADEASRHPQGRITALSPARLAATSAVSYAILEEAVDGAVFFAFVWGSLHAIGPVVASAARVMVAANTWSPQKRKIFSPMRSLDTMITDFVGRSCIWGEVETIQMKLERALKRAAWSFSAEQSAFAGSGKGNYLMIDVAIVRGSFAAAERSPTRRWVDGLLSARPTTALVLADLYGRYARSKGFTSA